MEPLFISIGSQCSSTVLFEKLGVKRETLPFDWMFSTPCFVYTILKMLLIDGADITDIVDNHFFCCDKHALVKEVEHLVTDENGEILVNTKYNVCFPHDQNTPHDREKYIRRMERLKQVILDNNSFIFFVYVSVSSPISGNYTLDGIEPIQQIYEYTDKINDIIKSVRTNYKIIVFDTNKPPSICPSDVLHVVYHSISQKDNWADLLPELIYKCTH
jgi:hypothetical protein